MARTKEFDETQVLDRAMEIFHAQGFQATSFADLTTQLGVSRQSLYDTYGDKQALFLAAMKRYLDRIADCFRGRLDGPPPVRAIFGQIFDQLIASHCANGSQGCFVTNTLVDLSPDVAAARALALDHSKTLESLFAARLARAQREGDLAPDKDPVALARFFHHTLLGVAVAARAHDDPGTLHQTARIALQALD